MRRRPLTLLIVAVSAVAAALVLIGPPIRWLHERVPQDHPVRPRSETATRLFDLGSESNVPTWYTLLLLAGLALALALCDALSAPDRRMTARYSVLAAVALLLSLDEGAMLHEDLVDLAPDVDLPTFAWVVPGAVLAGVVGVGLLWIARGLPRRMVVRLVVAGTVFLAGALGAEAVSGWLLLQGHGFGSWRYISVNDLEEGLEMAGVILALRAVLAEMTLRRPPEGLTVGLTHARSAPVTSPV